MNLTALQNGIEESNTSGRAELLARIATLLELLPDEQVEQLTEEWISELHIDETQSHHFEDDWVGAD